MYVCVYLSPKSYGYGRATLTAYGYGAGYDDCCTLHGRTSLRLRAYYAYGYGRIAATTTAYYGLATGCKLTSGHYNRER